ncbi:DUF2214 family protein [uncultured Microbulbifer sp.]|uniref:DUF2214 family protein n=1 Tax=uncultured Microbulbifer sp. TaxID=348147 RepID=UPI0026171E01|nr:DUF2214 family protein [uncultured Microbulbifer sp.]
MNDTFIRYGHFLGIILLASMLISENILFSKTLVIEMRKKLAFIDLVYGISAVLTLTAGLFLWLYVGKPKEFYSDNPVFHAKLGLFLVIALISVIPTVFLLKNRNSAKPVLDVPTHIIAIKRLELLLLLMLPYLGVLISRGTGYL